jgi:hypothetical protein
MKTAGLAEIPLTSADNAILSEMVISTLRADFHLLHHVTCWRDVNGIPIVNYHQPSRPIINYHPKGLDIMYFCRSRFGCCACLFAIDLIAFPMVNH